MTRHILRNELPPLPFYPKLNPSVPLVCNLERFPPRLKGSAARPSENLRQERGKVVTQVVSRAVDQTFVDFVKRLQIVSLRAAFNCQGQTVSGLLPSSTIGRDDRLSEKSAQQSYYFIRALLARPKRGSLPVQERIEVTDGVGVIPK